MKMKAVVKVITMFLLAGILFFLSILLILSTWGTGLGRVIVISIGIILIVFGIVVMIGGISDIIKILRS
jgi:hypothetical protein